MRSGRDKVLGYERRRPQVEFVADGGLSRKEIGAIVGIILILIAILVPIVQRVRAEAARGRREPAARADDRDPASAGLRMKEVPMKRFVRRDWRNVTIGLLAGLCLAFAFGAAGDGGDRYQLHVWSADSPAAGISADHGAYRIDTDTGQVFEIQGTNNTATQISFPSK